MLSTKVKAVKKNKNTKAPRKLSILRLSKEDALEFPQEAPILGPRDIFIGDYTNHNKSKCCLLGHANKLISGDPHNESATDPWDACVEALKKASEYILGKQACGNCCYDIEIINDEICPEVASQQGLEKNSLQARIWNLGMGLLGYTVNNPEAKHIKTS